MQFPMAKRSADAAEGAPLTGAAILVFARAPEAGRVKTRLIPALGAEGAASVHRSLVERTLAAGQRIASARLELWCAPDLNHRFFDDCASRYRSSLRDQCGGDLGERMSHALGDTLGGCEKAILVGSDIPALDANYMQRALEALDVADAVFGPAEDGGYVLVGLKRSMPPLFQGVPWGSDRVMASTRERLLQLGMSWCELETLWDVDRPEDLRRLQP